MRLCTALALKMMVSVADQGSRLSTDHADYTRHASAHKKTIYSVSLAFCGKHNLSVDFNGSTETSQHPN